MGEPPHIAADIPATPDEPLGWDAIAALTGGVAPEHIEELRAVRSLEPVYPLLHALFPRAILKASTVEPSLCVKRHVPSGPMMISWSVPPRTPMGGWGV
jgi:hypothetical protein